MSRKIALCFGQIIETSLNEKLSSFDIDLRDESSLDGKVPEMLIIKDHIGSFCSYHEMYPELPLISIGPVQDSVDFIENNGKVILNSQFLGSELSDEFLGRFVNSKTSSLSLEFLFQNKIKNIENIKMTGHTSMGYYMDMIAADLYQKDYNVTSFRQYFCSVISLTRRVRHQNRLTHPMCNV